MAIASPGELRSQEPAAPDQAAPAKPAKAPAVIAGPAAKPGGAGEKAGYRKLAPGVESSLSKIAHKVKWGSVYHWPEDKPEDQARILIYALPRNDLTKRWWKPAINLGAGIVSIERE